MGGLTHVDYTGNDVQREANYGKYKGGSEVEINTIIDAFITAIADNFRQIFIENKHLNIVA